MRRKQEKLALLIAKSNGQSPAASTTKPNSQKPEPVPLKSNVGASTSISSKTTRATFDDEEATQLQSPIESPMKKKASPSPAKRVKFPDDLHTSFLSPSGYSASAVNTDSRVSTIRKAVNEGEESYSYRALPREASFEMLVESLPYWTQAIEKNASVPVSDAGGKLFTNVKFLLTGLSDGAIINWYILFVPRLCHKNILSYSFSTGKNYFL
jgi:hypothetical protein